MENRVNKIRDLTEKENWFLVPGSSNPADIPTRDINMNEFVSNVLWWNGPEFLTKEENEWPSQDFIELTDFTTEDFSCELKKNFHEINTFVAKNDKLKEEIVFNLKDVINPEKFSSLGKLLRVTTYVLRFIHNIKKNTMKKSGVISAAEVQNSEK